MEADVSQIYWLSKECWECLSTLRNVGYVHCFVYFWTNHLQKLQQGLRELAPGIRDDIVKLENKDGKWITFSMSDEALSRYKPVIGELVYFASAVRMLSAYEEYIRQVVENSYKSLPAQMDAFEVKHGLRDKQGNRNIKGYWSDQQGRGIKFLSKVFDWEPNDMYRPALRFFFRLRNITVHNKGLIDQKLCELARDRHFNLAGDLKVGQSFQWNTAIVMELHGLLTNVLVDIDRYVSGRLSLEIVEDRAFWE